ncbi:MAG: hypothetical protein QOI63_1098, partial [Thermoplasmata archaeon]|nr:hypothetical protein [Thermoplasmata archaeon]
MDGDNVPPQLLGPLIAHLERAGPVSERRIFRNWRSTKDAKTWDDAAKRHAFERIDRYKTTEGKNASDVAVVVTAMDLFHGGMRRFCIASGDTDFSPLVERLRRGGSHVVVVGHKVDGGLLADLSDEYLDWRSLVAGAPRAARDGPEPRLARGRSPARAPPPPARSTAKAARKAARPAPTRAPPPAKPAERSRPARPARKPAPGRGAGAARDEGALARLHALLLDSYEVARTDGEVDAQGWLAVDRLGTIARGVDPDFSPAKYGLGSRTSLTRVLERAADLFEVQAMGRS